ncbi:MAG: hypothetical protein V3S70_11265 [Gammaproteobacteria bacterium]
MGGSKRSVEHYKDHELVCEVRATESGWQYTISVVSHHGNTSEVKREESTVTYASDLEALHEAEHRGRQIIDMRQDQADS